MVKQAQTKVNLDNWNYFVFLMDNWIKRDICLTNVNQLKQNYGSINTQTSA